MTIEVNHLWQEHAVCLRRSLHDQAGDWEIVVHGPLATVVDQIDELHLNQVKRLKIALPDRHVAPVGFDSLEIQGLLKARRQSCQRVAAAEIRGLK
ncbi:MAG: hypothetical protein ABI810_21965 [Sphingomonas bacterium]